MNLPSQPDQELEQRLASSLLDVLIRAGLILAMVMLCYQVFAPFLTLMVWALILAVAAVPHPESPGITSVGMIDITAKVLAGLPT
jgi:hypothetical protein